jgi:hypothetical protein
VYASLAQDLFKGVLPAHFKYDADDLTGADDDVIAQEVNMATFYDAGLQLFQIATTNNWQDIMYANVLQGRAHDFHVRTFFYLLRLRLRLRERVSFSRSEITLDQKI